MNLHPLWLWICFEIGMGAYMLKRAYFLVKGPNPVANTYAEFIQKCWIPLVWRFIEDNALFWMTFYPNILNPILSHLGVSFQLQSSMAVMPAPLCIFVGMGIDGAVDFAVTKLPFIKDWQPQMPPPLKAQANSSDQGGQ